MPKSEFDVMGSVAGVFLSVVQKVIAEAKKIGMTWEQFRSLSKPEGDEAIKQMLDVAMIMTGVPHGSSKATRELPSVPAVKAVFPTIDCDTIPTVPQGWGLKDHHKMGKLVWDPAKVLPLDAPPAVSPAQQKEFVKGNVLWEALKGAPVLNVNAMYFLIAHPTWIPNHGWAGKNVFFWGTQYVRADEHIFVPFMFMVGSKWHSTVKDTSEEFSKDCPAAIWGG